MIEDLLQRLPPVPTLLGNSLWTWAAALVTTIAVYLVLRLGLAFGRRKLTRLAERTDTQIDDLILELVDRTHGLFLFAVGVLVGSRFLEASAGASLAIRRAMIIAFFVQGGIWGNHVLAFLLDRHLGRTEDPEDRSREALTGLFTVLGRFAIWSVVLLLALDNSGFDVTALIAGLGLGGIAVGLALQNILQDTFASLSIILDKPFEVGDFITVGNDAGSVERIGLKTTRVRSLTGEQLVFGNHDLLSSRIRNFKRLYERRLSLAFGVLYQTPAGKLQRVPEILAEIIGSMESARFDRAHFKGFGDSSLDFEAVYWVPSPDYKVAMDVQQAVNLELFRRFEAEEIGFAYPTRTVFLEGEADRGTGAEDPAS
jgi:small-conductance mechanosensitive channel